MWAAAKPCLNRPCVSFEIRWLSAPASLANLVLLGWLLGVQYARAPVILLVVGNVLNIVLDLWLVMGLHMNVQGLHWRRSPQNTSLSLLVC